MSSRARKLQKEIGGNLFEVIARAIRESGSGSEGVGICINGVSTSEEALAAHQKALKEIEEQGFEKWFCDPNKIVFCSED